MPASFVHFTFVYPLSIASFASFFGSARDAAEFFSPPLGGVKPIIVKTMHKRTLYTIGYEKATPDTLVAALKDAGVKTLIDVRAVPASRRPGFSKNKLAARLEADGIAYVHLRDLGTPKAGRDAARSGQIEKMHGIFKKHMKKPEAQMALDQAIEIAKDSPSCLLCLERSHDDCHRGILAAMMQKRARFAIGKLAP
jgi:uncharacterized protein (DUF488 family)